MRQVSDRRHSKAGKTLARSNRSDFVAHLYFQLLGQVPGWRILLVQNTSMPAPTSTTTVESTTHHTGIQIYYLQNI